MMRINASVTNTLDSDRRELFSRYAERRAQGEIFYLPTMLPPEERRLYVRQTLREDNLFRIENRPEGAQAKFDKLAKSLFHFFRGAALLYYRDYAGTDGHLPRILAVGDVHPANFGVMLNENGAPFFSINDFDEAYFAPFSWDIKRGGIGFIIAAQENGLRPKKCRKVVKQFVKGYLEGLLEFFARNDREKWHQFRLDNSPPMIRELLESAQQSRKEFLCELIDLDKGQFRATEEIVPYGNHTEKFQQAMDRYRSSSEMGNQDRGGHFKIKDVAIKKGSGTASLGLDRYFVLIDRPTDDLADDLIMEFKHSRHSALEGLTPGDTRQASGKAERIVWAQQIHLVGGDPYYGYTTLDQQSFMVRERSPYKNNIDTDTLNYDELKTYANICGKTLAQIHARSDADTGVSEHCAEQQILASIDPASFPGDIARFAETGARRLLADYEAFKKDHRRGVFKMGSSRALVEPAGP